MNSRQDRPVMVRIKPVVLSLVVPHTFGRMQRVTLIGCDGDVTRARARFAFQLCGNKFESIGPSSQLHSRSIGCHMRESKTGFLFKLLMRK